MVWRKSLFFGCHGFTVFDARGDLAFRVDCYASSRRRTDVVLMGAAGEPLLTVRRARRLGDLLASERWVIYDGDGATPLLSVRRHTPSALSKKALAHVTPLAASGGTAVAEAGYVVEGSYGRRACAVRDACAGGAAVAEVRRKEAVGDDVFRLVAGPKLTNRESVARQKELKMRNIQELEQKVQVLQTGYDALGTEGH